MLKRRQSILLSGLLLLALLLTVYLSMNQADYDKRTLQPYSYQGMSTGPLFFEKGSYTFTFSYAYTPDTQIEIIRSMTADADNRLPAVLVSAPLSENGQTAVTLTFAETVYDLRLRYTAETELGFTNIESIGPVWRDTALTLALIALVAVMMGWMGWRERKGAPQLNDTGYSLAAIHILLLCAVFLTLPILRDFFVNGHDLAYHLMRIENIKDGLLDGQFPVRIGPAYKNGLGYASPILYPELFLYLPALFRLCGVSLMVSYQALVFLINLATLFVTYHAVKKLTGKATVALIASLVYGLGFNRLITFYTRAAIGEALALIFFPCVMLGMAEALHRGKLSKWLIIGMTGLIQAHVVSVEIAVLFCALYTLLALVLRKTTWRGILRLAAAAGITVLLNLWFLVPFLRLALEPLRMFNYTTRTALHAVYPAQLFSSFASPFGKAEYLGTTAEMPLSVGLLPFIGILLYLLKGREDDRTLRATGLFSLGFGLAALLIASTLCPWTYIAKIPVLGELLFAAQFPWRYLGIAGFFLAVVFGIAAYGIGRDYTKLLIAACLILAIFNAAPFLDQFIQEENQVYVMREKTDMDALLAYTTWDYDYADTDFKALEDIPVAVSASGDIAISEFSKHGTHVAFDYAADTDQTVTLPLYLYPGYTAVLNGTQALAPFDGGNHLLALSLPAGEGSVSVYYKGFWYFNAANYVSLLTAILLAAWAVLRRRRTPC